MFPKGCEEESLYYRIPTAIELQRSRVAALKASLAEEERKLALLQDPYYELKPGQARIQDGRVYGITPVSEKKFCVELVS